MRFLNHQCKKVSNADVEKMRKHADEALSEDSLLSLFLKYVNAHFSAAAEDCDFSKFCLLFVFNIFNTDAVSVKKF